MQTLIRKSKRWRFGGIALFLAISGLVVWAWAASGLNRNTTNKGIPQSGLAQRMGVADTWVTGVIRQIQAEQYAPKSTTQGTWLASNYKQNLQMQFHTQGITLELRNNDIQETRTLGVESKRFTAKERANNQSKRNRCLGGSLAWHWQWQTSKFGRPEAMQAMGIVSPQLQGTRIEYKHAGLTEWYENRPEGVEQGFTIHQKPETRSGDRRSSPAVSSLVQIMSQPIQGLTPHVSTDKKSVEFLDAHAVKVLEYGQLLVLDARGQTLPAELRVENNTIVLAYADHMAVYPVTVDPLITS